ncbi:hypothetical protein E4U22_003802 [Claviceps purpurea]|nr:hypothetical protein E4U11_003374 [Claviceps purpurea]KAG6226247.1 hypothetical protein E4U34_007227 [Claviceps purpurea]KAG6239097.1 hypothetical protein E4U23_007887 [Claviceps purpurea]KAG6247788.1 hypothetical protein E4U49_000291 [Claviceps purpurea]KAG6289040.1 hypothetical protein E4U46_002837 [Claviceps purpurea]
MPPKADGRRKSGGKPGLIVTLKVPRASLRKILLPETPELKLAAPQDSNGSKESLDSPAPSATLASPAAEKSGAAKLGNSSESNAATPAAEGTPVSTSMAPPSDGRKKGAKRSAAAMDGMPKIRGKPGPKKKPRLEDGTIDHTAVARIQAAKLGPKANQGAINAGLRALDRSGKPCRKWERGGFKLKSFTGVVWEICRWTAPSKKTVADEDTSESGAVSASADNGSGKENKPAGQEEKSVNDSNRGVNSVLSVHASSPAPVAISAAS